MNAWTCEACGWCGAHVNTAHGGRRRFTQPGACGRCGFEQLRFAAVHHPKFSHQCRSCAEWFDAGIYSTECLKCRGQHASERMWTARRKTYVWTSDRDDLVRRRYDSKVKGRVAEIARALGWPGWTIKKRAAQLGVATKVMKRLEWTPAHVAALEEWTGARTSRWIAKFLTRKFGLPFSELAIVNKQKRLGWSRRVRADAMTMVELERALGIDHRIIAGWVTSGKLKASRRDAQGSHQAYEFEDKDIVAFVRDYRSFIRLDRVDPDWFLGLVLPPTPERQHRVAAAS